MLSKFNDIAFYCATASNYSTNTDVRQEIFKCRKYRSERSVITKRTLRDTISNLTCYQIIESKLNDICAENKV